LLHNEDPEEPYYGMLPRKDSFEISYKGFLIFSKLGANYWPAIELVASKCRNVAQHEPHGCSISKYLAGMGLERNGSI